MNVCSLRSPCDSEANGRCGGGSQAGTPVARGEDIINLLGRRQCQHHHGVEKDSAKWKSTSSKALRQSRPKGPKRSQRAEWLERRKQGLPGCFGQGDTLDFSKAAAALREAIPVRRGRRQGGHLEASMRIQGRKAGLVGRKPARERPEMANRQTARELTKRGTSSEEAWLHREGRPQGLSTTE